MISPQGRSMLESLMSLRPRHLDAVNTFARSYLTMDEILEVCLRDTPTSSVGCVRAAVLRSRAMISDGYSSSKVSSGLCSVAAGTSNASPRSRTDHTYLAELNAAARKYCRCVRWLGIRLTLPDAGRRPPNLSSAL